MSTQTSDQASGLNRISTGRYGFEGLCAVVTGAGTGIGRSIGRAFLEQGANLVAAGLVRDDLQEAVSVAPADRSHVVVGDVATLEVSARLVSEALAVFGRIDVLVTCAGVFYPGEIEDTSLEDWREMMRVNADGVFLNIKDALPALEESGGNVVVISSVSGICGDWGQPAYNATKGAANLLVKSLALDLGAKGVRVNAVAPAYTLTRMAPFTTPEALAPYFNRFPLGRVGEPEDVARAVLLMASRDAGFVTGAVLPVDGGLTAATGHPHLNGGRVSK
ncbi:MAG: SDR family oxidoreductase [Bifidobacteriaceae bacterium]|nr:SDR family oxidoreductase [Bifidobacteriaceae bacterium]